MKLTVPVLSALNLSSIVTAAQPAIALPPAAADGPLARNPIASRDAVATRNARVPSCESATGKVVGAEIGIALIGCASAAGGAVAGHQINTHWLHNVLPRMLAVKGGAGLGFALGTIGAGVSLGLTVIRPAAIDAPGACACTPRLPPGKYSYLDDGLSTVYTSICTVPLGLVFGALTGVEGGDKVAAGMGTALPDRDPAKLIGGLVGAAIGAAGGASPSIAHAIRVKHRCAEEPVDTEPAREAA